VLCIPPHTTHISQPLDISFFCPLKLYWSEGCHKYVQENPSRIITKYQFSTLFSAAWYKAIKPDNLVSGFRKAGICPFNSEAIKIPECLPCDVGNESGGNVLNVLDESDESSAESESDESEEDIGGPSVEPEHQVSDTLSQQQLELFQTRFENG